MNRLVAAGIFATVAIWTLTVTGDPNAVTVVLAAVALACGVKPPASAP